MYQTPVAPTRQASRPFFQVTGPGMGQPSTKDTAKDMPTQGAHVSDQGDQVPSQAHRDSSNTSEEWRELLIQKQVDGETISWLKKEGFDSIRKLNLLDRDSMEQLVSRREDTSPLPFSQVLALRQLFPRKHPDPDSAASEPLTTRIQDPSTSTASHPLTQDRGSDRNLEKAIQNIFGLTEPNQSPSPMDFHHNSVILGSEGKQASYYDITEFIPGYLVERERVEVPGSGGKLIFETGPKKPILHKVSINQWGMANARIMHRLVESGSLQGRGISDYLAYTVKVHQLATRYEWESVLLYDREYRQLQANLRFGWGVDVKHLSDVHLFEKRPVPPPLPKVKTNAGGIRNIDPRSSREICIKFNRGQCNFHHCKFSHVCSICYEDHTALTHDGQKNGPAH